MLRIFPSKVQSIRLSCGLERRRQKWRLPQSRHSWQKPLRQRTWEKGERPIWDSRLIGRSGLTDFRFPLCRILRRC